MLCHIHWAVMRWFQLFEPCIWEVCVKVLVFRVLYLISLTHFTFLFNREQADCCWGLSHCLKTASLAETLALVYVIWFAQIHRLLSLWFHQQVTDLSFLGNERSSLLLIQRYISEVKSHGFLVVCWNKPIHWSYSQLIRTVFLFIIRIIQWGHS